MIGREFMTEARLRSPKSRLDVGVQIVSNQFPNTSRVTFFDVRLSWGPSGAGSRDSHESGEFWDWAGLRIGRVLRSGKWFWQRGLRSAGFWA
jgi:hypothetical protein